MTGCSEVKCAAKTKPLRPDCEGELNASNAELEDDYDDVGVR